MAIRLVDRYPLRVDPASSDYPHGKGRNKSAPDAVDGTPYDMDRFNDHEAFFQGLVEAAGIEPDGTVDTVPDSQYMDALSQVANGILEIDVAGDTDVTLDYNQYRVNGFRLTGALAGDIDVVVPNTERMYTVVNDATGDFTVTAKTATGSGVVVPQGQTFVVRCDGTDVVLGLDSQRTIYVGSVADFSGLNLIDGQQVRAGGFWQSGDGAGRTFIWRATGDKADHDGGDIIDPEKLSDLSLGNWYETYFTPQASGSGVFIAAEFNQRVIDIKFYGAGTEVVDNLVLQAIADIAFSQGRSLLANHDFEKTAGECVIKCGFISNGTITVEPDAVSSNKIIFEEDEVIDYLENFASVGGLTEGEIQLTGIPESFEGYTLRIQSDDVLCNRIIGAGASQLYNKRDISTLQYGSKLSRPLVNTYTNASLLQLSRSNKSKIKLNINVEGDASSFDFIDSPVTIARSDVKADVRVYNRTSPYAPLQIGVNIAGAANIDITGSVVGADLAGTGYAYYASTVYNLTFSDVSTRQCRKSVDGVYMFNCKVLGGQHGATIASHLSYGLEVSGAHVNGVSRTGGASQELVSVVGDDITIQNNTIVAGDVVNPRFIAIRNDIPIRSGGLTVKGNTAINTVGGNPRMASIQLTSENFDYQHDIEFYDSIDVSDNRMVFLNGGDEPYFLYIENINTVNPAKWPVRVSVKNNKSEGIETDTGRVYLLSSSGTPAPVSGLKKVQLSDAGSVLIGINNDPGGYALDIEKSGASNRSLGVQVAAAMKRLTVRDSELSYILSFSGVDNAYTERPIIRVDKCNISQETGGYNISGDYMFTNNVFENLITIAAANVRVSSGNLGVTQDFALNGVWQNIP